jgi:hypothetical protein
MPTVWVTANRKRRTRFHRSPDCRQLKKAPARGERQPVQALDLNDVGVRPCKTCYPDAPALKIFKPYCHKCRSPYPCRHNGGIEVVDRRGHRRYVWPDTNQAPYYRAQGLDCVS